jgi:hypothetical protein
LWYATRLRHHTIRGPRSQVSVHRSRQQSTGKFEPFGNSLWFTVRRRRVFFSRRHNQPQRYLPNMNSKSLVI